MAKDKGNETKQPKANGEAVMGNGEVPTRQFVLQRVYLKDLSFESPASPDGFKQEWKPRIAVDLRTTSNVIDETSYEVVLSVTVTATIDDKTMFLAEVQQGGIFYVQGIEEEELRRVLAIVCPNTLFPYARETIDNVVTKGTFPPLMLAQVNFEMLYAEAMKQVQQQAGAAEPEAADS